MSLVIEVFLTVKNVINLTMIIKDDVAFVKRTFNEYKLGELLGLSEKYLDAFIEVMCWSYQNTDADVWMNSKYQHINNFVVKTTIVLGGAVLSILKYYLKYQKYRVNSLTTEIIAMPFGGAHVRYKYIYELVDNSVSVQYPPLFHYQHIDAHIKQFEEQGRVITLGNFRLKDVFSVMAKVIDNYRNLKICHKKIELHFGKYYGHFISVIIISLLYKKYIRRILSEIPNDNISRKWLFDYDFDYKYIIFNNEIKKQRNKDVTIHIQHGAFFDYDDAYCNPVSDVNLCCSPREKEIIENNNKYHSRIFPLGSSLQSIDNSEDNQVMISFDVLVLLTDTVLAETADFQKKLLKDLSRRNIRVLIRYRPQSAHLDKKVLNKYTTRMKISSGTTLKHDILSAKMVVCFSEDAIYECFRNKKRVVYVVKNTSFYNFDNAKNSNMCITSPESFDDFIFDECSKDYVVDYSKDEFVLYNFGDFEYDRIKTNLNRIIDQI